MFRVVRFFFFKHWNAFFETDENWIKKQTILCEIGNERGTKTNAISDNLECQSYAYAWNEKKKLNRTEQSE